MENDRTLKCLFERRPQFYNYKQIGKNGSTLTSNVKHPQKNKSTAETTFARNSHILSAMYMQRQKRIKYKQLKKYIMRYKPEILQYLHLLNSMGISKLKNNCSSPEIRSTKLCCAYHVYSSDRIQPKKIMWPNKTSIIINQCCTTCDKKKCFNPFFNPNIRVATYRCEVGAKQTCCCNCNSDAMFEVMKSLYDCYKKKNCINCKCILCGPRFQVETVSRAIGEDKYTALEHKTPSEKEKTLREMAYQGVPLPEGRTPSEKALIAKVQRSIGTMARFKDRRVPYDKLRRAKAEGLLTPLEGKTAAEKERLLIGMAKAGVPLPEGKTSSERKLIKKVREEMGLPAEPKTPSEKVKMSRAFAKGIITPLEGKSPAEKERILRRMADVGIPLPEGRTSSERALIEKIKMSAIPPLTASEKKLKVRLGIPSDKVRKAKAEGLLTPLEGKTPQEKEKILKKFARIGVPLPEPKTSSEKSLVDKVRKDLGLPPQPRTELEKQKLARAYAAGKITPLEGKTSSQKELALRKMAEAGVPLPEGKTSSEKKLIQKVRRDLGLPPEPKTASKKARLAKAFAEGIVTPLEGKSRQEKKRILRRMEAEGISLPEGRTASEKALIEEIKRYPEPVLRQSEKLRAARAEGLLTPLEGKTHERKEAILKGLAKHGLPLPEGKTSSERNLVQKIKKDMGLPLEPKTPSGKVKLAKAYAAGIVTPLEGKSQQEKERALRRMAEAGVPLPEGRTSSEKALIDKIKAQTIRVPSEKLRKAKAEGWLTPLEGKTMEQKEQILRGLAKTGVALPEGKTLSEKDLIHKVKQDLGLPPEPKTSYEKKKMAAAYAAGIITPLEGKAHAEKEKVLRRMAEEGVPLPEGRTSSERALIQKIKATTAKISSEKLTPTKQKEQILRGLAKAGEPLPEGKTRSEKDLISKVKRDLGLPTEPQTSSERIRLDGAYAAGIITPLEGKTPSEKERIIRKMAEARIPLPEGRTASEKAIIDKVKAVPRTPAEKLRRAKAEGYLTPLEGKPYHKKEKILRGLAKTGVPLPEGKTASERHLIEKVKKELGLPPEAKTPSEKVRLAKAYAAGIITPLEGKSPADKEKVLRRMATAGIPLPEGRTASEKALIDKIYKQEGKSPLMRIPSEKLRKARAAGLLTPLKGKTDKQREKILRKIVKAGLPLPKAQSASEGRIIEKVRHDLGLPLEPQTSSERQNLAKMYAKGLITPIKGKSPAEKEKILKRMAKAGVPLPKARTPSEQVLIDEIRKHPMTRVSRPTQSERLRVAKVEGLLTPLEGKTKDQKEAILKGLAKRGLPLPEGGTASEKQLVSKIKREMALPPDPKTPSEKVRLARAYAAGIVSPLEGKAHEEKERTLRRMAEAGVPLPEGRTSSEKALIDKVKATTIRVPSEKLRKAKAEGWLTPLEGKTTDEKERILRGLAKAGIPLPKAKTQSEKKLIEKVRRDLGLPPEPETLSEKAKIAKAYSAGIITPLEGKSAAEKEKVLQRMADTGIPLPEGRSASEKALINKIKARTPRIPSEKMRKAREKGLLTPLEGKTEKEKERILRGLTKAGIPLPEGKTPSEKKLIRKVRRDMALPPEPETSTEKRVLSKGYAAGIITPLEGKTHAEKEKALRKMAEAGIPLPEGRTDSERDLINKVKKTALPPEKIRAARDAGLWTPLEGKSLNEKERILKGLAKAGIPLPEAKTQSEKKLIEKIRRDLGLPPEPDTSSEKANIAKAYAAGIVTPLEGKSAAEKEKVLQIMADAGIPLPEGRSASEKALINKIKARTPRIPSEKMRKAREKGLLTPLEGKTEKEKERILRGLTKAGIPLPEGKTPSEKKLIRKVRRDMALPPEPETSTEKRVLSKGYAAGIITPLEGKTHAEKEKALLRMAEAGIPLPEGRTDSERDLIDKVKKTALPPEKIREARDAGLLTPLEGKSLNEKERVLKGLAKAGMPLPEAKTQSEKKLIEKIRRDLGLPPEPDTSSEKANMAKAYAAGIVTPLEGKSTAEKEKVLQRMADAGLPLPEGRSASEKALINKIKARTPRVPSEKMRKAREKGLLTPLEGKTEKEKERILRGLTKAGIPLPEGKTPSEKKLIRKVRRDMALPPEPETSTEKRVLSKGYAAGIITPLEGKTHTEKEKALRRMAEAGIPLPEGRTDSEQDLIDKIKKTALPPEKMRAARAAGLLTPLEGKSLNEKERILKGLAKAGMPLPEAKTQSEKKLIEKIRQDLGLPLEPDTSSEKANIAKAYAAGIVTPLEGKSTAEKEKVLQRMAYAGVPLPEGRSASEKALINKIKARTPRIPSEKMRKAREKGLLTPLEGKTEKEKERILRGLTKAGIPLPEGKTPSEKRLIRKVRRDMALPPEPETSTEKRLLSKGYAAGIITPLEGKTHAEKEKALRRMAEAEIPLPEGRTTSEKALIDKIKKELGSDKMRALKGAGLLTPLEGKSPEEKERILKGLAKAGVPLQEGRTSSEKNLIKKVRRELGLPPKPETSKEQRRLDRAYAEGIITPLEGKSRPQKEKALRRMAEAGVTLPEGRTASERSLIEKIKAEKQGLPKIRRSEKIRRAKERGLMTPLEGKSPEEKERILRGLAEEGLPLPQGRTSSEKRLIKKVIKDIGLPPKPETSSMIRKYDKAYAAGIITPLEDKTTAEKEKALKRMAEAGVQMPEGRTTSERELIDKIKRQVAKTVSRGISVTEPKARAGITHDIQEIVKTTKCDRACGCDRKKIRFKHSFIKIRVTSPDISSFCSCPDECIPGVKSGVFVDNEGIKVTVGRVSITPSSGSSRTQQSISRFDCNSPLVPSSLYCTTSSELKNVSLDVDVLSNNIFDIFKTKTSISSNNNSINSDFDDENFNNTCKSKENYLNSDINDEPNKSNIDDVKESMKLWSSLLSPRSFTTNSSSYDSIVILLTDTSSNSYISELGSISVISIDSEDYSSTLKHHALLLRNNMVTVDSEHFKRVINYTDEEKVSDVVKHYRIKEATHALQNVHLKSNAKYIIQKCEREDKVSNDRSEDCPKLYKALKEILSRREFSESSSICVLVPSDETNTSLDLAKQGRLMQTEYGLKVLTKDTVRRRQRNKYHDPPTLLNKIKTKGSKGKIDISVTSHRMIIPKQNNIGTSITRIYSDSESSSNMSPDCSSKDEYQTQGKTKVSQKLISSRKGLDIRTKKCLLRQKAVIKLARKPVKQLSTCDKLIERHTQLPLGNECHTITSKLKKIIYDDQILSTSSLSLDNILEGIDNRAKTCYREVEKPCTHQKKKLSQTEDREIQINLRNHYTSLQQHQGMQCHIHNKKDCLCCNEITSYIQKIDDAMIREFNNNTNNLHNCTTRGYENHSVGKQTHQSQHCQLTASTNTSGNFACVCPPCNEHGRLAYTPQKGLPPRSAGAQVPYETFPEISCSCRSDNTANKYTLQKTPAPEKKDPNECLPICPYHQTHELKTIPCKNQATQAPETNSFGNIRDNKASDCECLVPNPTNKSESYTQTLSTNNQKQYSICCPSCKKNYRINSKPENILCPSCVPSKKGSSKKKATCPCPPSVPESETVKLKSTNQLERQCSQSPWQYSQTLPDSQIKSQPCKCNPNRTKTTKSKFLGGWRRTQPEKDENLKSQTNELTSTSRCLQNESSCTCIASQVEKVNASSCCKPMTIQPEHEKVNYDSSCICSIPSPIKVYIPNLPCCCASKSLEIEKRKTRDRCPCTPPVQVPPPSEDKCVCTDTKDDDREYTYDDLFWLDDKEIAKLKYDLAKAKAGLKFEMKPKCHGTLMSSEEDIEHYNQKASLLDDSNLDATCIKKDTSCKSNKTEKRESSNVICECPPVVDDSCYFIESTFSLVMRPVNASCHEGQGIAIVKSGKRSGTPCSADICCYGALDISTEESEPIAAISLSATSDSYASSLYLAYGDM